MLSSFAIREVIIYQFRKNTLKC